MPGLIGSQGVRPGALNMGRIFRALRYRTEQAKYAVYHRPAIYVTDAYGVPSGTIGSEELLLPDLPVIIRPGVTADYQQQRQGSNIIGAARVYTPNITTIKSSTGGIGAHNFSQPMNPNFNEIEGWDRFITSQRTIRPIETDVTGSVANGAWTASNGAITTDGESITNTTTANGNTIFTAGSIDNILEADRLRFKIKTNFDAELTVITITNQSLHTLTYTVTNGPPGINLDEHTGDWFTVDLPFVSGTTSTSIYSVGDQYTVTVADGGNFDYEKDLKTVTVANTGYDEPVGQSSYTVSFKEMEFYKSISWHVHSLKDMTDGYMIFDCVRTQGRNDSRRRAYD
tara:strand:- start:5562 stop:6587 length:1026 start_codon:yes stop_codon:yes gene_type:complete